MINRNCADYTNFDGKTNKKIVQAPGGASSFSLAWSDEKTDYGQERQIKKSKRDMGYAPNTQPRVMESPMYQQEKYPPYQDHYSKPQYSQQYGQVQKVQSGYMPNYGGEQGYKNYEKPQIPNPNQYYGNYGQVDQIDIAVRQLEQQRPPSVPRNPPPIQGRSSIKINAPSKPNFVIGNDYNYWKDDGKPEIPKPMNRDRSRELPRSNDQPTFGQRVPAQEYTTQKTSVKVHNPPGGRQNFTLG